MSYANLILYGAVLPSWSSKRKEKEGKDGGIRLDAGDPHNKDRMADIIKGLG